jgi:phosphate:Na+ symporter
VPLGNLLMRGAGSVVALALFLWLDPSPALLGETVPDQIVHAHILFNVLILIAGIPLSGLIYRASQAIVALRAEKGEGAPEEEISALDPTALQTPAAVRVCETVEVMLQRIIELYEHPDRTRIEELAALDDRVDRRHAAIKLYLSRIQTASLTEDQAARYHELLGACVKLEQVGDIIVRNLLPLVEKKLNRGLTFTDQGWRELTAFHRAVLANARLAFNVLVSRDLETARQLVLEKDRLRAMERQSSENHFARLRDGTALSIETSTIHLDTIRDLKQVNSLLASMAYPVLEEHGLLGDSRLKAL